jgi:hypothetical protein
MIFVVFELREAESIPVELGRELKIAAGKLRDGCTENGRRHRLLCEEVRDGGAKTAVVKPCVHFHRTARVKVVVASVTQLPAEYVEHPTPC